MTYTFGENQEASRRLRRLAEVYEPETRDLLNSANAVCSNRRLRLALDLGCGPGWSTQLIATTLYPMRTVGLEASEVYVAEARSNQPQLEFIHHNVLTLPFPVYHPDFLFCRFLLTHLPSPHRALESWAYTVEPGAILAIHETESLYSANPALSRYYEMVAQMQRHHGQELYVGASLDAAFVGTEWTLLHIESVVLEKSMRDMAQLHLANLRTWGKNDFAVETYGKREIVQLEHQLGSIASGDDDADVVYNTAKRVLARRK